MLVAIASRGPGGLEAEVDARFGRARGFIIVDTDSGEVRRELENPAVTADHGAGPQAAALIAEHKVDGVVAGNYGPKAHAALTKLGLRLWTINERQTVARAMEALTKGELEEFEKRAW